MTEKLIKRNGRWIDEAVAGRAAELAPLPRGRRYLVSSFLILYY